MLIYEVTLTGESREVYSIEADSEDEARANWAQGVLVVSECYGMDVDSAREVDE